VTERYWPQNGSKLGYSPTNWMLNWMVNTKHDQYLEYLTISESPVLTNVQTCPLCLMSVLVHSCPMTLICQALLRHTRRILCSRAACRVQRSAQAFSSLACSLCGKGGRSQPRAVQGSSASLTICPPWTHRFLCAVVILALVEALRKGLARILGTGPVLR
jgi:hypothetical protein